MNIVFSANSGWNIYNFRLNLVKKLLEKKNNIIIVSPFDPCVEKLIELGCKYVSLEFNSKSFSLFSNFLLIIKYYQIFKKYNVNVASWISDPSLTPEPANITAIFVIISVILNSLVLVFCGEKIWEMLPVVTTKGNAVFCVSDLPPKIIEL